MTAHALATRHPNGELRLFLRVVRAPSGVYVVFAAGQHRPGHDPHSSWHRDGRVHQKSYARTWIRRQRQPLDSFGGAEPFIATSVDQMPAAGLPECVPTQFATVMDVSLGVIDVTPGRQQVHIDLVAAGAAPPAVGLGERPLLRWWLNDDAPSIVISLYEFPPLNPQKGVT